MLAPDALNICPHGAIPLTLLQPIVPFLLRFNYFGIRPWTTALIVLCTGWNLKVVVVADCADEATCLLRRLLKYFENGGGVRCSCRLVCLHGSC